MSVNPFTPAEGPDLSAVSYDLYMIITLTRAISMMAQDIRDHQPAAQLLPMLDHLENLTVMASDRAADCVGRLQDHF